MPKTSQGWKIRCALFAKINSQEYLKPQNIHDFKFSRLHLSLAGNFLFAKISPSNAR